MARFLAIPLQSIISGGGPTIRTRKLDFYFDYLSPYAFFAWRKLTKFCADHQLELTAHPVVFGKLLDHWGQLGPAEVPPKRDWLAKYCYRYAQLHGFEFQGPKLHPFNPLTALRLSLNEVAGEQQGKIISAIFEGGWCQGRDISDLNELLSILAAVGVDGAALAEQITNPDVKELLKLETETAIEQGVFGVPTMIIDGELFWGNDQFEHMAQFVKGCDPIDVGQLDVSLGRSRGIDRKKITK